MSIDVKICGLKTSEAVDAAVSGGAKMLGFVFFAKSPRNITRDEARDLLAHVPEGILKVALMVDPDDSQARSIGRELGFDLIQLHGLETPERVAELKTITALPMMKAVGIETADDLVRARAYEEVCDYLLLDAKAPKGSELPGGNAVSFDWTLLSGLTWQKPWILAGGLKAENLAQAVKTSGATFVDVSSGVEDAPGQKNPQKIREFLKRAQSL